MFHLIKSSFVLSLRCCHLSFLLIPFSTIMALINFRDRTKHYIVICDHIGDFLISIGFLSEYRKKIPEKDIVIVSLPKFKSICHCLLSTEEYYYKTVSSIFLHNIVRIGKTAWGQHVLLKIKNLTIVNPVNDFTFGEFDYIVQYPQISFVDCIKYGVLGLDENAKFTPPEFSNVSQINHRLSQYTHHRTVILVPYASILSIKDKEIFELLAKQLQKMGYTVLTNVATKEQPCIKGTKPLVCSLEEIPAIAEHCGYVIGLRSGLMDLLAYCNCDVFVLYPEDYPYRRFFHLSMLELTKASIKEYELTGATEIDVKHILNHYIEKETPYES